MTGRSPPQWKVSLYGLFVVVLTQVAIAEITVEDAEFLEFIGELAEEDQEWLEYLGQIDLDTAPEVEEQEQ
jgi:hypothetical protein